MKWINILGLCLQFAAFWFAAPELLGEAALKRFESGLKKLFSSLPIIAVMSVVLLFSLGLGGYGVYTGLQSATGKMETGDMLAYFVLLGASFIVYAIFMVFFKRIQQLVRHKIAEPLIEKVIHQSEVRKQALIIGAILFTIGFFLQLLSALFA